MTYTHPAPSQPRIPPHGAPHHASFAKNHISFTGKPTKEYHFHDGETPTGDHAYLGLFVRPLSLRINPPFMSHVLLKITLRKDAPIRVLFKDMFFPVFKDVSKGAANLHFHVVEL